MVCLEDYLLFGRKSVYKLVPDVREEGNTELHRGYIFKIISVVIQIRASLLRIKAIRNESPPWAEYQTWECKIKTVYKISCLMAN